ncbi:hypothetical protein T05_11127 [Trichinella murrelli]|uniref:Uncharacterized protein n=2 Tax=Trichinella TaxID=6333 RepID=A0A0V0U1W8_9BILA|nr:hypothetical protein T05_11127 [Trichinella murrelli]
MDCQITDKKVANAESLGFPRSREGERALCLPKEQGRVCTLPCLREGSFTLQDGAHFWSLHPPPALNISSPTPGMFAISQSSFIPDPRLTELGPTGNRIYLLSFLVLLRAVRDLLNEAPQLKTDFSNYSASCTQRTFYNATTCHVSQTNECTLTNDKAPFMAIVICIALR